MNASARLQGTNWLRTVQAFTCAGLLSLGCGGSAVDGAGQGGSGNINVGGSTTGGAVGSACFSPTQNLSTAYQAGSKGCACNPATDASVCVQGVALICESSAWIAVQDGPCMPMPGTGGAGNVGGSGAGGKATGGAATGGKATGGSSTGGTAGTKACGARAGNTCNANEYCAYQPGQYCGQADAEATCQLRPQACDAVYAPVCGCDGQTYGNSCEAAIASTGVYATGACTN